MTTPTLTEVKDLVRRQDWPAALAAADAVLSDMAVASATRRALHVVRLKAMLFVPVSQAERVAASRFAGSEFRDDPQLALMRARLLRRSDVGSSVLRLARVACRSPAHFGHAMAVAIDVLLERGKYRAALRAAGPEDQWERILVATVSRLAWAAIVNNDMANAARLIAHAQQRDRYATGVTRYAMLVRNSKRERTSSLAVRPRHIAILSADPDDALRFGVAIAPRLGLTFVGDTAQLTNEDAPWVCPRCGPGCEILSEDFRSFMQQDDRNWFPRVAAQFDTTAIMSCEKSLAHYLNHDPDRNFDAVIIYRDPLQLATDALERLSNVPLSKIGMLDAVRRPIDDWSQTIASYLNFTVVNGTTTVLNIREFELDEDAHLLRLAERLGLVMMSAHAVQPSHHFCAAASTSIEQVRTVVGPSFQSPALEIVTQEVSAHRNAELFHRRLERRYRRVFTAA